jgi:hypothetical protein
MMPLASDCDGKILMAGSIDYQYIDDIGTTFYAGVHHLFRYLLKFSFSVVSRLAF